MVDKAWIDMYVSAVHALAERARGGESMPAYGVQISLDTYFRWGAIRRAWFRPTPRRRFL